jgi:hypothetical protein
MIWPVVVVVGFMGFLVLVAFVGALLALTVVVVVFFLVVVVVAVVVVVVEEGDAARHVGTVMVLESNVTAPFRASTRP